MPSGEIFFLCWCYRHPQMSLLRLPFLFSCLYPPSLSFLWSHGTPPELQEELGAADAAVMVGQLGPGYLVMELIMPSHHALLGPGCSVFILQQIVMTSMWFCDLKG